MQFDLTMLQRATRRTFVVVTATAAFGWAGTTRAAETILFIGNSFTYAQGSAVQTFQPGTVTDLNGTGSAASRRCSNRSRSRPGSTTP